MKRFDSTNNIGVSLLNLCFSREIGWIVRNVFEEDMGIDANVEQVKNGRPTARYISVQLKTGLGNVHIDKNGDFIYYLSLVHYEYWMSSSIPVIIALCDPESALIYWEAIRRVNIDKTNSKYKIKIKKEHILSKASIPELESLINTYQSNFEIPDSEKIEEMVEVEYWNELLKICSEAISNSTLYFNQLDEKYKNENKINIRFMNSFPGGYTRNIANKQIRKSAMKLKLAIDVCKTQFKAQVPVIVDTHISAIKLFEFAVEKGSIYFDGKILELIRIALEKEKQDIESNIITFSKGVQLYRNSKSPNAELRNSEYSFSLVLEDYVSCLRELVSCINAVACKLEKLICA